MLKFQKQGGDPQGIYFVNNRLQESTDFTRFPIKWGKTSTRTLPQIAKISTFGPCS